MTTESQIYLKKTAVCEQLGISARTIENLVARGEFPPPVRLGKWSYWSQSVVDKWHQRQFAMQDAWMPNL